MVMPSYHLVCWVGGMKGVTDIIFASIRSLSLGAPFWYVFSISVALSLSMIHVKHYPRRKWCEGGRKEHKAETNCIHV